MIEVFFQHQFPGIELNVEFLANNGTVCLFGDSGTGKTTTINVIAGLLQPSKVRLSINQRVVADSSQSIWLPPRQRNIGYVFQEERLFPHMSVENNLLYGQKSRGHAVDTDYFAVIVSLLNIKKILRRKPRFLSGGEKKRVAIGRALLSKPEILLLDEPLAGLDNTMKQEVLSYVKKLVQEFGIPMLYVTHSLEEARQIADGVVLFSEGKAKGVQSVDSLDSLVK